MKGVRFSRFGGPEVLEIVDLPDPHPGPGVGDLSVVIEISSTLLTRRVRRGIAQRVGCFGAARAGVSFCQRPSGAMSLSACLGPQVPGL
jgi:hypothetical protein